jgi:hypothetical protein
MLARMNTETISLHSSTSASIDLKILQILTRCQVLWIWGSPVGMGLEELRPAEEEEAAPANNLVLHVLQMPFRRESSSS